MTDPMTAIRNILGMPPTVDHEALAEQKLEHANETASTTPDLLPLLSEAQVHATLAVVEQIARAADALDALVATAKTANLIAHVHSSTSAGYTLTGNIHDRIEAAL